MAKLQIYSVEDKGAATTICIVRCVGGLARPGQEFEFLPPGGCGQHRLVVTVDRILRYERPVDFLDPPHNAKVHLSGDGIEELKKGDILVAREGE